MYQFGMGDNDLYYLDDVLLLVMPMFLLFGVVGVALVIQHRLFVIKLKTDTD